MTELLIDYEPGVIDDRLPAAYLRKWAPKAKIPKLKPSKEIVGDLVDQLFPTKETGKKAKRSSGGRWRTLKDGRRVAISGTEKRGAMTSRGEARVRDIERDLIDDRIETALVVLPSGETVFKKGGDEDSVTFTDLEMGTMTDAVLTHNHPTGSSFSPEDVWMAIGNDVAEVRAVGIKEGTKERYLYRMTRPEGGWGATHPKVTASEDVFNVVLGVAQKYAYRDLTKKVVDGDITIPEAQFRHYHTVWSRMAGRYGWEYSRERL